MTPTEDPTSPTGQEPLIRPDVGGWISGPCLGAEELDVLADWRADLDPARLPEQRQGPAQ